MRAFLSAFSLRRGAGSVVASYGLLVLAQACTETPTTIGPITTIAPGTTAMSVDPDSFLGSVACSGQPGAMQSYVATLTDVTDPENHFVLPSSPPTSCAQSVYFQYVTIGHVYTADVDGYPLPAQQLVPLCGKDGPAAGQLCSQDTDCPMAYGCAGACKITTYLDGSPSCLQSCGAEMCGNGTCDPGETCRSCPKDCGPCATCGDGVCQTGDAGDDSDANSEDCGSCPQDCNGACPSCGDGVCSLADHETCASCPQDCGQCDGCLAAHDYCKATSLQGYLDCAQKCNATSACLTANANCVTPEFHAQEPCVSESVDAAPTGGQLRGQVKACTCNYTVTEGARQMIPLDQPTATTPLAPRWQTPPDEPCGEGDPPTAVEFATIPVTGCAPLVDHGGAATVTVIQVIPAAALSGSTCALTGFDGGTITVTGFNVVPAAATMLPSKLLTPCEAPDAGSATDVASYPDVVPSRTYQFTIQALGESAQVVASSQCFATPVAGFTVTAMCDPLIPVGGP